MIDLLHVIFLDENLMLLLIVVKLTSSR